MFTLEQRLGTFCLFSKGTGKLVSEESQSLEVAARGPGTLLNILKCLGESPRQITWPQKSVMLTQGTLQGWCQVTGCHPHPRTAGSGSSPASRLGTASSGPSPAAPAPPRWKSQPHPWRSMPPTTPNTCSLSPPTNCLWGKGSTETVKETHGKLFQILSDLNLLLGDGLLFPFHSHTRDAGLLGGWWRKEWKGKILKPVHATQRPSYSHFSRIVVLQSWYTSILQFESATFCKKCWVHWLPTVCNSPSPPLSGQYHNSVNACPSNQPSAPEWRQVCSSLSQGRAVSVRAAFSAKVENTGFGDWALQFTLCGSTSSFTILDKSPNVSIPQSPHLHKSISSGTSPVVQWLSQNSQ